MKRQLVPHCVVITMFAARLCGAQDVDRVGLSFSDREFATAQSFELGAPVTVYVLASLASPIEGVSSFSCRVEWNDAAIKDLVWQIPATIENDGALSATFAEVRRPVDGHVVLATATGQAAGANCAAMRITNTPVVVGTLVMDRTVPVAGQIGETLALNCAEDLGPPGAPGNITIIAD
jgi:hypothetical protein